MAVVAAAPASIISLLLPGAYLDSGSAVLQLQPAPGESDALPTNLDRYKRIAPLYDFLDFLTDAIARYGPCSFKGSRVACLMQASELDEISRSIHPTLRSPVLISAQPC
jgi:hypothetical protein